jgi:predicted DNA-binding protein (UPF0251 family)
MGREIDFDNMPEADLVVNYVNTRYRKGLNTNIYIIGLSGSGKSSASQRIGELIIESREDKGIELFICDSLLGFLRSIKKSKEGDIIIIEEVSVLFSSRRAMAKDNVNIGKVLDTCRKKQLCIISNAPLWNTIDSHMRAMGHMIIETLRINKTKGVVISKFHRLQTNPATSKTYKHTMRRQGRDVSRMFTRKPDAERWAAYEALKDKFIDELYEELLFDAKKKQDKKNKEMQKHKPSVRRLTERELQIHQLYNVKKLNQKEVAKQAGISQARVCRILQNIQKKTDTLKEKDSITL